MYKVVNSGSPEIIKEIFKIRKEKRYNFRHQNTFKCLIVNCVYNDTERVLPLGPQIWELIPTEIKEFISLNGFTKAIKKWKPVSCPCRLCKTYIYHVGFISYLRFFFAIEIKSVSKFKFHCLKYYYCFSLF